MAKPCEMISEKRDLPVAQSMFTGLAASGDHSFEARLTVELFLLRVQLQIAATVEQTQDSL
jgi:hypothetical protein